ncbi:MAG: hypothetical protein MJE68_17410 [Proteobacteria bacterium]|nr:hypothetical protein [Pseudomonadota bacterium]
MWTAGLHTGPSKKVPWGRLVLPKMLGEGEGGFILWLIKITYIQVYKIIMKFSVGTWKNPPTFLDEPVWSPAYSDSGAVNHRVGRLYKLNMPYNIIQNKNVNNSE